MKQTVFWLLLTFVSVHMASCIFVISNDKKAKSHSPADTMVVDTTTQSDSSWHRQDTSANEALFPKDTMAAAFAGKDIDTRNVQPQEVVAFAKTLIGVPYKYASSDPAVGFDCSGFITYVFHHFGIQVPRSSIDFTHVGVPISVEQSKPGDIILFTGTDSTERFVGHMGIIVSNTDSTRFIHSTSGKQYGVTITPLNSYYKGRYVKTIRLFRQNDG